jgi:chromosomal replication initiator protein
MNEENFKNEEYWEDIKKKIQREANVSDITYDLWFKNLEFQEISGDIVYIKTEKEDERALGYLDNKFKLYFETVIGEELGKLITVKFLLNNDNTSTLSKPAVKKPDNDIFNPDYTFETFVVGKNNMMAHQVSVAVAEDPGKVWNPLYIHGGPGLGKTHLMHSIGNFILNKDPSKKVIYVTSEQFTNDVIESLRSGNSPDSMSKLREKYRTVDVLMVDDIQFIIGKEATQEEFFHTFNTLHDAGKQIILSSDKNFKEFKTLDERYISRFAWGMTVDIQTPDYETRSAILKNDAEKYNIRISEEIIDYIASNIQSNIRELEGALNKILAFAKLNNVELTLQSAEEALRDVIYPDKPREITPSYIINVVCEHFNIKVEDIISKKRNAEIALPRQIAMYLCREMTDISLNEIGSFVGNRDHTTVMHGSSKIAEDIKKNPDLAAKVDIIRKKISP